MNRSLPQTSKTAAVPTAVLAAMLALSGPGIATAMADEATGEEIVVTGRGLGDTPATPAYDVQQIDREALLRTASGRIEDALASVAGFQQFRRSDSRSANPSAQGVTLRALGGNATSRALVLLDGVPMADPFFGYVPLSALAPERLASARVTRGGGSGAFGAGAIAGTIELESADAATMGLLNAGVALNDRGESEASASLAPRLGAGFAVASVRWDRGQGFWTTPPAQRGIASVRAAHESWSASLRMVAPLASDIELQARLLAYDDARTLRFRGADSGSSGQDASLRLVGRGAWQFDALAYVQARDFNNVVISSSTFRKTLDQRRTPATGLGGKLELRPPVSGGHVLRLGADWRQSQGTMQEEAYGGLPVRITARRRAGGTNSDLGLYAEDDWTLGDLVLTAGLRADRWSIRDGYFLETARTAFADRSGWDTSLRGGAVWRAGGGVSMRAAAYSGIRLPTLNELYRPFTVFPVTTRANAALRNEALRGFEAGLDFAATDALRLSLTAFDNRVRHAIANVTIGSAPGDGCDRPNGVAGGTLRQRCNVDALRARGLELSAGVRSGAFSFDGSMALTRARVHSAGALIDGMRPAQTPKLAASGTLAWTPDARRSVAITLRHTGMQFEDDLQTDRLPAATTLDAHAQVPLAGPFALVLRAENFTDARVVTRKQGQSLDLGAPRTLWVGVKLGLGR